MQKYINYLSYTLQVHVFPIGDLYISTDP